MIEHAWNCCEFFETGLDMGSFERLLGIPIVCLGFTCQLSHPSLLFLHHVLPFCFYDLGIFNWGFLVYRVSLVAYCSPLES